VPSKSVSVAESPTRACRRSGSSSSCRATAISRIDRPPPRYDPGHILYKHDDGYLWLNVAELAYRFLDSLQAIEADSRHYNLHLPPLEQKDKGAFVATTSAVTRDIRELCAAIGSYDQAEERASHDRGEIEALSSAAAYAPDWTLNAALIVDPTNE
jgi:hypothetical protein